MVEKYMLTTKTFFLVGEKLFVWYLCTFIVTNFSILTIWANKMEDLETPQK